MSNTNIVMAKRLIVLADMLSEIEDNAVSVNEVPKKPEYVGIFFDDAEREKLFKEVPATHAVKPAASHITVIHASQAKGIFSNPEVVEKIKPFLGKKDIQVKITSVVADEKGQAVTVELDPAIQALNPSKKFHITISTIEGVGAKYSNDLLAKATKENTKPITGLVLTGTFDVRPAGSAL